MNLIYRIYKTVIHYWYPKRKQVPKKLRQQLWLKYHSGYESQCYVCHKKIDADNFHAAHVIPDKLGGPMTLNNLRCTCMHCNLKCGTRNLNDFKKKY